MITHDGIQREGLLYVPESARGAMPLVLLLHGFGGDASAFAAERAGLLREAERRGWLVAIPGGTPCLDRAGNCWASRDDPDRLAVSRADDVGYLRAVIADLRQRLDVDAARVYVVGFSNGGSMAHRFAAEAPELLAAGAAIAGTLGVETDDTGGWSMAPLPTAPLPMLIVKAQDDPVFGFFQVDEDESNAMHADYEFGWWAGASGCYRAQYEYVDWSNVFVRRLPKGVGYIQARSGCEHPTHVRMVVLKSAGHAWPTRENAYDADTEVLAFFDQLPR